MPGVPRELAEHHLHVRPEAKPVKQPLRRFAEERRKAIGEEIAGLSQPASSWKCCTRTGWRTRSCSTRPNARSACQPAIGYLVSQRGIEANPEKISALEKMELPQCLRTSKVHVLGLLEQPSAVGRRHCPCTSCSRSRTNAVTQADEAFRDLSAYSQPHPSNIAGFNGPCCCTSQPPTEWLALSVVERKEAGERAAGSAPIYYLGECSVEAKLPPLPEGHLACTWRRSSSIISKSIPSRWWPRASEIIGSKDANGRVAKWALVAAHSILYEPSTIKSQILADFFGAGIVITSPKGDRLDYVLQIHFAASNNVAEYEALIHGLKLAKEIGVRRILCFGDSDLVIQQASGEWDARDANMASYRFLVQQLTGFFDGCEFHHVPRANNEAADALSKIGSTRQAIPPGIALQHLQKPSITPSPESDSIFVPADSGAYQPNPPAPQPNPATMQSNPGASQPKSGAYQPNPPATQPNPATIKSNPGALQPKSGAYQPNPPATQPNPATIKSNPGALQPKSGAYQPNPPATQPNPATIKSNPEALTLEAVLVSVFEIRCVPSWAQAFLSYLANGKLPENRVQARQIERRAKAYTIINHQAVQTQRKWGVPAVCRAG
ncbi:hypothetical protein QYE76_037886 [Lolium multiflorum]|uniref:RNase H type-1 domain-containing protein n=1 Tax=Lolium multiflorum TaxID=4521 RepID=A0AAD8T7U1_LOLMU|nr:hypothetical protein QYE76_037886 [Lolium multiflorum]